MDWLDRFVLAFRALYIFEAAVFHRQSSDAVSVMYANFSYPGNTPLHQVPHLPDVAGKKGWKRAEAFSGFTFCPIPQWSLELNMQETTWDPRKTNLKVWCGNITRLNPEKYPDRTIAHGPGTLAKVPHPSVYSRPRAHIVTSYQSNFKWDMSPEPKKCHRENGGTLGMVPLIINPVYYIYRVGIYWVYPLSKGLGELNS